MTLDYTRIVTALQKGDFTDLIDIGDHATFDELVELGMLIGPRRLDELVYREDMRFAAHIAPQNLHTPLGHAVSLILAFLPPGRQQAIDVLPEVLRAAFNNPVPTLFTTPPPMVRARVTSAVAQTAQRFRHTETVRINLDATNTLPEPTATPPLLSAADFTASAGRLGVDVPAIRAVADVESGGSGFRPDNRPKLLFEAHHFGRLTSHRFDKSHPHLSVRTSAQARAFYSWNQYPRLFEAMLLDVEAAVSAASWGKFQVMGFNHNGWPDPVSFAKAMYVSEANHLMAFEAFCRSAHLVGAIQHHDWARFARGYNGSGYAENHYDTKMAAAFRRYGGR